MLLSIVVRTSERVAGTSGRRDKIGTLAALLADVPPPEVPIAIAYLSGRVPQGRIGVGYAALRDATPDGDAPAEGTLTLTDVDAALTEIAGTTGKGSAGARVQLLKRLFASATEGERRFLLRLLIGELRQGALDGLMVEAVAKASGAAGRDVRRAVMMAGDLSSVAAAVLAHGADGLGQFGVRLFHPIQPMLAQPVGDIATALHDLGEASLEYKLDGARIQVHKSGDEVRVYSRRLREVTAAVPEVVELTRDLAADNLILDGEVLALAGDGSPQPFQVTMRRFGRKLDVDALRADLPLSPFFFDLVHLDGTSLIDEPQARRVQLLADLLPDDAVVPRTVTADPDAAAAFLASALDRGHEGVMAKALATSYEAGSRGGAWLKIKPVHTLDLVVLAAEWGSGRRKGWLSNLHLGARDPAAGGFVMLGKTFKGMTDEILAWQTKRLQELEIGRDKYTVHVRPELVVEVAFNDVQASPQYPGGVALRFARIKRYRDDKRATDADTIETVRAIRESGTRGSR